MKNHISKMLPWHFSMNVKPLLDSAFIWNVEQEFVLEVQGKTSEESREIAKMICVAVNVQEETISLLKEMLQAADDAGIYVSDASIHRKVVDLLARLTKEATK